MCECSDAVSKEFIDADEHADAVYRQATVARAKVLRREAYWLALVGRSFVNRAVVLAELADARMVVVKVEAYWMRETRRAHDRVTAALLATKGIL